MHRIDPFIIQFSDKFGIRWYGLAYVAGFLVGMFLLHRLSRKNLLAIPTSDIDNFLTWLIGGVIIGARLGYVLFYEPSLFITFTGNFPFWGVFAINWGGMSSHGGFIGVALAIIIYCRRHNVPYFNAGDAVVMAAPLGLFFGRMANFINGELYGRPTDVPWAICFPTEIWTWSSDKFSSLVSRLSEMGYTFSSAEGVIRAVQENDKVAAVVRPMLTPRHPSQLYEAILEGLVLFGILWWFGNRKKRDGQVAALFFWCYAIFRILGEQLRMPDPGIGLDWLGLTRGQWLSLLMIVAGGVIWYMSVKMPELVSDPPKKETAPESKGGGGKSKSGHGKSRKKKHR